MRWTLVVLTLMVSLGALFWVLQPPDVTLLEIVPARAMAVVIVEEFPESLDFLAKTRFGEWLEMDSTLLQAQAEAEWFTQLRDRLIRACMVVHRLERKENGAFRPHMTVFLKPEPGCELLMEDWIRQEVVERFGDRDLLFEEEGSALVLRGPEKGQILYLAYEPGWMIVSNSESGWKDVQLVLARQRASIVEKQSFREIQKQIGSQYDLFLYFGGEGGWMLPEFGYSVNIDGQHVCDTYYSIDP